MTKPIRPAGRVYHTSCGRRKEEIMKIDLILPGGGAFHFERPPREPMSRERFELLFWLALALIGTEAFIRFFALMT